MLKKVPHLVTVDIFNKIYKKQIMELSNLKAGCWCYQNNFRRGRGIAIWFRWDHRQRGIKDTKARSGYKAKILKEVRCLYKCVCLKSVSKPGSTGI